MTQPLSEFSPNELTVRGVPIDQLISGHTFLASLVFMLTEQELDNDTARMLDALLVAWIDHGANPPSTQNVRNVAAARQGFPIAAIAGLATFGGAHVPIEACARFLIEMELRSRDPTGQMEMIRKMSRVPGYGHPVHETDPRVPPLCKLAAHHVSNLRYMQALHDGEKILETLLPHVPLPPKVNLAGVTAALWLDMGFDAETVSLIPCIGRMVGWAAHYSDQLSLEPFAPSLNR